MALVDQDDLIYYLSVSETVAAKLLKHRFKSEIYLRDLKGHAWYEQMREWLDDRDNISNQQAIKLEGALEAESYLCYYFGLPHLNLKLDDDGALLVQEWQDDGAGVKVQRQYATMQALSRYREELIWQVKWIVMNVQIEGYRLDDRDIVTRVDGPGVPPIGAIPPPDEDPTRCDNDLDPDELECPDEGDPDNDDRYFPDDPDDDGDGEPDDDYVATTLFAANGDEIVKMELPEDGSTETTWTVIDVSGLTSTAEVVVCDPVAGYVFFNNSNTGICRMDFDGANQEEIITGLTMAQPNLLAINRTAQTLIVENSGTLTRYDYNGDNNATILVGAHASNLHYAEHPEDDTAGNGWLYYRRKNSPFAFRRTKYDGTTTQDVLDATAAGTTKMGNTPGGLLAGLADEGVTGRLFYTEGGGSGLSEGNDAYSLDLTTKVETVLGKATGGETVYGVAWDTNNEFLYYAKNNSAGTACQIRRCDADGNLDEAVGTAYTDTLRGIALAAAL